MSGPQLVRPAIRPLAAVAAVCAVIAGALALGGAPAVAETGTPPSAPVNLHAAAVTATSVTLAWSAPTSPGSAPLTGYRLRRADAPGPRMVPAQTTTTVSPNLTPGTSYRWSLWAVSSAGTSAPAVLTVTTVAGPAIPPQRKPAPVSTSHYLRDLTGVASHDTRLMHRMGAIDAPYNPPGHRYVVLQDIGGQTRRGVILSATTRFVSYAGIVNALKAFVAGYHSTQRVNAPMLLAVGTNNDGLVSSWAGMQWARAVVNPVRAYAAKYANIHVVGADDMEPGFRAGFYATRTWLSGYLAATSARFVFNGSADGCPTGRSGGRCNNGWSTSRLNWLSSRAAPNRILSLPQIYNGAMPYQWRNISASGSKVRFGGPLTEWTACAQARSCSSVTNVSAWTMLFRALRTRARTAVSAMPYGTDLRIN